MRLGLWVSIPMGMGVIILLILLWTILVVTYSDCETDVIVSNPETWRYFNNGPILYSSLFQGEVYDARQECLIEGWATAVYDDSVWEQSVEVALCGTINRDEGMGNAPGVGDHSGL